MQAFSQSPKDPDFVQNPYPFYDQTRASGPLFLWADYDNLPCLTGHKEVSSALRDKRMGREAPPEFAPDIPAELTPFYDVEAHSMLELEPPRHTRLRSLVLRAFTSRRIKALAPEIEMLCHALLDQCATDFDLLEAYAKPLPVIIIARLLGVPETDRDDLLRWSNAMVAMYMAHRTPDIEKAAIKATNEFTAYIKDHITHKTKHPSDDLISALITAEQDGAKLSRDEMVSTCILLLNAGHEATVHSLGNATKALIGNNITTINEATVEEALRFDPPLHMFTRWIYEDLEIAGHTFKRGDKIACLLGAANRDPLAYPDPNTFNPQRKGPANTAFGGGIHFCVGAPLARLELLIGLKALFEHHPSLTIRKAPKYADLYHFHGLEALHLTTAKQPST